MDILIFCREGYADLHKSDKQFLWVNRTGSERRREIDRERERDNLLITKLCKRDVVLQYVMT